MSIKRLQRVIEECEGLQVEAVIKVSPGRRQVEINTGPGERDFIPGVAIHVGGNRESYRSLDDLAEALLEDLAVAAVKTHATPTPPKRASRSAKITSKKAPTLKKATA